MALFKEVKKPVIKGATAGKGDVSPLRPRYVEKTPPCADRCPHGQEIREVLVGLAQHETYGRTSEQSFELAWKQITERNPFPAVCGRTCQHPCELGCNRKSKDGAVAIHLIERFLGDYALAHGFKLDKAKETSGQAVAVVGAGPAGLSCAYQLARRGYAVTVFDAAPKPGGMMRYGLPRSLVPAQVLDGEIANLVSAGVEVRCGCAVGREITVDDLRRQYAAVFFAQGLQKPSQLALQRVDEGAVVVGELRAEVPDSAYAEAEQVDARVVNTISPAIAQGRNVAEDLAAFLSGRQQEKKTAPPLIKADRMKLDWYPPAPPHADLPPLQGLADDEAVAEAKRCLSCGMCFDCETCWMYCSANGFVKLAKGEHYKLKLEVCNGCKKCAEVCPCGYIEMN
jgi:NADPH-dependent glutamate synthase beta subunit-like oxidoreductase